ncbi:MAG: hypothetical protein BJ554DRAFT_7144, partial [Olpidium bornovanus]
MAVNGNDLNTAEVAYAAIDELAFRRGAERESRSVSAKAGRGGEHPAHLRARVPSHPNAPVAVQLGQ